MSDIPREMDFRCVCVLIKKASARGVMQLAARREKSRVAGRFVFCIPRKLNPCSASDSDQSATWVPRFGENHRVFCKVRAERSAYERDPNRGVRHRVRLTRKSIPRQFSLIRAAQQHSVLSAAPPPLGWHNIHKGRKSVEKVEFSLPHRVRMCVRAVY